MSRVRIVQVTLIAILLLVPATSAFAARQARIHVKVAGECAGDTISGAVSVRAKARTRFTLRLLKQQTATSRWTATQLSRRFKSGGASGTYRFRFNVSAFDAYAYRLRVSRPRQQTLSPPIAGASCAPGAEVPEAPLAILLPLSLLAAASLLLRRRAAV